MSIFACVGCVDIQEIVWEYFLCCSLLWDSRIWNCAQDDTVLLVLFRWWKLVGCATISTLDVEVLLRVLSKCSRPLASFLNTLPHVSPCSEITSGIPTFVSPQVLEWFYPRWQANKFCYYFEVLAYGSTQLLSYVWSTFTNSQANELLQMAYERENHVALRTLLAGYPHDICFCTRQCKRKFFTFILRWRIRVGYLRTATYYTPKQRASFTYPLRQGVLHQKMSCVACS
jgi:hypothetical protein